MTGIVSIHEFGHLVTAKMFGVYCSEFSIGMGPKLFSKKGKETEFSIRAFPIGGFVSMAGDSENDLETTTDTADIPFERTLPGIAKWKRCIVMYAGIFMNIILAIALIAGILLNSGYYAVTNENIINEVMTDSPAQKAGLLKGDEITKISFDNGYSISPANYLELSSFIATYDGNGLWHLEVKRNSEIINIDVNPVLQDDSYVMGVSFGAYSYIKINLFNSFYYACDFLKSITKLTLIALVNMFRGVGLENLSGPVGIYNTVKEASSYGIAYYLEIVAMLSMNVGIMNAIPLPIFDGGRAFLLLIEAIIGKPLDKKVENIIMTISVGLLIVLMLFVTYMDISKLF